LQALNRNRFVAFIPECLGRHGNATVVAVGSADTMLDQTHAYSLAQVAEGLRQAQVRLEEAQSSGAFDFLDPLPAPSSAGLVICHIGDLVCNGRRWLPQSLLMDMIDCLLKDSTLLPLADAAIAPIVLFGCLADRRRQDFRSLCERRGADVR